MLEMLLILTALSGGVKESKKQEVKKPPVEKPIAVKNK